MRKLTANEIDVKVKKVTSNGALLLLYKTARVDMQVLDEKFGAGNWQCDYKTINGVLYCGIGVYLDSQWVWKWDCGIESREDGEGNEKKGEASDAFKRAGFKWGIGRELYTTPFIWANIPTKKNASGKYDLLDPFQKFFVDQIGYDTDGNINKLQIKSDKGETVFSFPKGTPKAKEQTLSEAKEPEGGWVKYLTSDHIVRINSCETIPALEDCLNKIKAEMGPFFEKFRKNFVEKYKKRETEIMQTTGGLGL